MSHNAHAPAGSSNGGGISSLLSAANAMISPRENIVSTTIASKSFAVLSKMWDLFKHATATVVDAPLGIAEASLALANNVVGSVTMGVDSMIIQPMDSVRAGVFNLLTNPSSFFSSESKVAHAGAH